MRRFITLYGKQLFLILLTLAVTLSSTAWAKMYRWKDEQGRVHFSDSLHNIPEQYRPQSKTYQSQSGRLNLIEGVATTPQKTDTQSLSSAAPKNTSDTLSIPYISREGSANRIIINIKFNNHVTAPIMVDTGSPGLILSTGLAAELGLVDDDSQNMLVLISGIGGTQISARAIVKSLTLGGIEERMIPAYIIPGQSTAYRGLIGMDILSGYSLTIDSANKRLIGHKMPPTQNRPGGRDRIWWQKNFKEILYYMNFWKQQEESLNSSHSPYSRLTSKYQRVKQFIQTQRQESQKLYNQLEQYARMQSVPRHWRQ